MTWEVVGDSCQILGQEVVTARAGCKVVVLGGGRLEDWNCDATQNTWFRSWKWQLR